jgi:hypothetical protein
VGHSLHHFQRRSGTVTSADQRSNTGASYHIDGDSSLAKHAQNSYMRNATRKTTGER